MPKISWFAIFFTSSAFFGFSLWVDFNHYAASTDPLSQPSSKFSKIQQSTAELLTTEQNSKPHFCRGKFCPGSFSQNGHNDLHRIWKIFRFVRCSTQFGCSVRYVAPVQNENRSKATFCTVRPTVKIAEGCAKISKSSFRLSPSLPIRVLQLQYVVRFRNKNASLEPAVENTGLLSDFLTLVNLERGSRNVWFSTVVPDLGPNHWYTFDRALRDYRSDVRNVQR